MLDKRFNAKKSEDECLASWEEKDIFKFKDQKKSDPFSIMMPPPNITGTLHMGHALTFSLQDILVRFQKKLGKSVLWQAGTDHAGIATEIVVEKKLNLNNEEKNKRGREEFLKEVWKWKEKSGNTIVQQLKRLGTAVDWSRQRFTMDHGLSLAVKKTFIDLYNEGIIYKDKRLVNWDPTLQTAVSDLEVNQNEIKGKLWFLKYQIDGSDDFIEIATTRPETIFGDTGIAVHPKNKKFAKFINKFALVPIINKKIPIFADKYADPQKGTGAVKITPAHDFNDFIVGKRNSLEIVNIFDKSAKLNFQAPQEFQGLDRFVARTKLVKLLLDKSIIFKIKNHFMTIPVGERTGTIIEPLLTNQWFCNAKKLSIPVNDLIKKKKIRFHPESWTKTFNHWIKKIEPWCISRQIWWGHRIPAWYDENGEIYVAENENEARKKAQIKFKEKEPKLIRDPDVLDTWFSSALWPFSTLGWPEKTEELKRYYPTSVLITGFDIIFFWVARMIMMGQKFIDKIPFKDIYIHPLVKDHEGKKMSKSKGNIIDPLSIIDVYGADALRFTLADLSTQGRDIKLSDKLVENSRNFITKIWNIARFFEMNKFKYEKNFFPKENILLINLWILKKFMHTQKKVIQYVENFHFNRATEKLYQFIWNDFCDLYIELIKPYLKSKQYFSEINNTFAWVFKNVLNLSNPFMPFVTEEIAIRLNFINDHELFNEKINSYENLRFNDTHSIEKVILLIKSIRENFHNEKLNTDLYVSTKENINFLLENKIILESIFGLKEIKKIESLEADKFKIFISSEIKYGVKNLKKTSNIDLQKQIEFYEKEIIFFEKKLSNENFKKNAPKKIVEKEIEKLDKAKINLKLLITKK